MIRHRRAGRFLVNDLATGSRRAGWSGLTTLVVAIVVALGVSVMVAQTAVGDEDYDSGSHDGVCEWWGSAEWIGWWGTEGTARGVTSLWDGPCTKVRVKMKWADTSNDCKYGVWTSSGGGLTRSREGYHIDYSDADVLWSPTWYGFRVNHSGPCVY